jgi:addiction module HigA family antidote
MILGFRDKRTRDFAAGERDSTFDGIARKATMKLNQLDAAVSLDDLAALPGNRLEARRARSTSRSWTITEVVMARTAIHPGEHLAEQLEELGMSAAELARQIRVPTNRVTQVLNGQRAVTGDTALRLGHFFGTSAEFWLNLQKLYELRVAERAAGKAVKALPRLSDLTRGSRAPAT